MIDELDNRSICISKEHFSAVTLLHPSGDAKLQQFLHNAMQQGQLTTSPGQPIVVCNIDHQSGATIILRTQQEADNAMHLSGIIFKNKPLHITRHKRYTGPTRPDSLPWPLWMATIIQDIPHLQGNVIGLPNPVKVEEKEEQEEREGESKQTSSKEPIPSSVLFRWPVPPPGHSIEITETDEQSITENKKLTDNTINLFLQLIATDNFIQDEKVFNASTMHLFHSEHDLYMSSHLTRLSHDPLAQYAKGLLKANIDLFSKDFLVFPIYLVNHWSVMIVCHPEKFKQFLDYEKDHAYKEAKEKVQMKLRKNGKHVHLDAVDKDEYEKNFPEYKVGEPYFCVLHLDSKRWQRDTKDEIVKKSKQVGNKLIEILYHSWVATHKNPDRVRRLVSLEFACQIDSTDHRQFQRINFMTVPQQERENNTDSAAFMCYYIQQFISEIHALKNKNQSAVVTRQMYNHREWEWLNASWFEHLLIETTYLKKMRGF